MWLALVIGCILLLQDVVYSGLCNCQVHKHMRVRLADSRANNLVNTTWRARLSCKCLWFPKTTIGQKAPSENKYCAILCMAQRGFQTSHDDERSLDGGLISKFNLRSAVVSADNTLMQIFSLAITTGIPYCEDRNCCFCAWSAATLRWRTEWRGQQICRTYST